MDYVNSIYLSKIWIYQLKLTKLCKRATVCFRLPQTHFIWGHNLVWSCNLIGQRVNRDQMPVPHEETVHAAEKPFNCKHEHAQNQTMNLKMFYWSCFTSLSSHSAFYNELRCDIPNLNLPKILFMELLDNIDINQQSYQTYIAKSYLSLLLCTLQQKRRLNACSKAGDLTWHNDLQEERLPGRTGTGRGREWWDVPHWRSPSAHKGS